MLLVELLFNLIIISVAQRVGIFPEAKMIVQGVAMDPQGEFLATMSNDR